MTIEQEIEHATGLCQNLEDMIVKHGGLPVSEHGKREQLLLGYWSLILDYDKGILLLLRSKFYSSAFALLRPTIEALVRAHVALIGNDSDIAAMRNDTYVVNFKSVGAEIDAAFKLNGLFDRLLTSARDRLHSFTHSGLSQVARRFNGSDLEARYSEDELTELVRVTTSSVFIVTNLVANCFNLEAETKESNRLYVEWGSHAEVRASAPADKRTAQDRTRSRRGRAHTRQTAREWFPHKFNV